MLESQLRIKSDVNCDRVLDPLGQVGIINKTFSVPLNRASSTTSADTGIGSKTSTISSTQSGQNDLINELQSKLGKFKNNAENSTKTPLSTNGSLENGETRPNGNLFL